MIYNVYGIFVRLSMIFFLTEQGISDAWLTGPRYTAADIALTTLLDRIVFLGLQAHTLLHRHAPFSIATING